MSDSNTLSLFSQQPASPGVFEVSGDDETATDDALAAELLDLDLARMTPIEAMTRLDELQRRLADERGEQGELPET